ncbi:hypothetical protein [Paraburkholderia aspalathi]|uniref:hypothetical protein n=1 Tax=Paraburkholderia aspalathi TaxID=1324617 RepID=UPI0038B89913
MNKIIHRFLLGRKTIPPFLIKIVEAAALSAINIIVIFSITSILDNLLHAFLHQQSGTVTMAVLMITAMLVWSCNRRYVLWRERQKLAQTSTTGP